MKKVQSSPVLLRTMQLGTFRFDATPPLGHGCCGGWITPVISVDDALEW